MPKRGDRSVVIPALVVFAVALAVRLVYAAQVSRCLLFQTPTIDAGVYYALAREFAAGHWLNPVGEVYFQPPFYPLLLGVWIKLAGPSVMAAKYAQFVLGSINCVLTLTVADRVFGRRAGIIAGLAAAFYAPMIYFDGELLTPTLQTFLNLSAILVLLSAVDRASVWRFAAAGLIFGLSLITRPDVLLFLIAAAVWAVIVMRKQIAGRRLAASIALMLACAVVPIVPVAVRNRVVAKELVLISSNGGLNFYIGNNPDYDRTFAIRPGPDWDAMQALPLKQNPKATQVQQDAYFYRRGLSYAIQHPLDYAALTLKKAVIYLTAVEGKRNHDIYYYRHFSGLYSVLLLKTLFFAFPLGLALPLAALGIARRQRRAGGALLILYLVAQMVATVAFFVCARYRVTSMPVMLIFAGLGGVELWRIAKKRAWRQSVLPLVLAGMVLVISNANVYRVDRDQKILDADTRYYQGEILFKAGDAVGAADELAASVALNPRDEVARFNYSRVLRQLGRPEDARRQLLECLKIEPGSPAAHAELGNLSAEEGNLDGAVSHLSIAARADKAFSEQLVQLAEKAYSGKQYPAARRALETVVSVRPDYAEARRSLGVVLMKQRQFPEAIAQLREACKLDPKSADSYFALGLAYHRSGQVSAAQKAFDQAIRIGPADDMRKKIRRAVAAPL